MSTYTQPFEKLNNIDKENNIHTDEINEIKSNSIDKNKDKDSNLDDIDNKLKKIVVKNTSKELVDDIFSSLKREEINYDNYNEDNNNENNIKKDNNENIDNENKISENKNSENNNSENNNSGYNNSGYNNSGYNNSDYNNSEFNL